MRLNGWLDVLSWSQAELSRRAKVSTQSVSRALSGNRVSRRVASSIVQALAAGIGRRLTLDDIEGLQIAPVKRRKRAAVEEKQEKTVVTSRKTDKQAGELKS